MEAHPLDQSPQQRDTGKESADRVSEEVAATTARVHVEGRGLDPELEQRFEDD
jgi:hypothetical protein